MRCSYAAIPYINMNKFKVRGTQMSESQTCTECPTPMSNLSIINGLTCLSVIHMSLPH